MEKTSPGYVLTDKELSVINAWAHQAVVSPDHLDKLLSCPSASFESIIDAIDTHIEANVAMSGIERVMCDRSIVGGIPQTDKPVAKFRKLQQGTLVPIGVQIAQPSNELKGWRGRGLCNQTDPDAFYPDVGESPKDAKKVCMKCDVREECLEYALENDEEFGVWGGLTRRERRRLKRQKIS